MNILKDISGRFTRRTIIFASALLLVLCVLIIKLIGGQSGTVGVNAMYFWKTNFKLNDWEEDFLKEHDVRKLYVRLFDVAVEYDFRNDSKSVVPIATTVFKETPPEGIEIVPTVYITLEGLRYMRSMEELSDLIVKRVLAMSSYNNLGEIREVQIDCDWTQYVAEDYNELCRQMSTRLSESNIALTSTIRLHQIDGTVSTDVQGYVLMLYNAVSMANPTTKNSILSYDDIHPYLTRKKKIKDFQKLLRENDISFSLALPTFSWGVVFQDGKYKRLVRNYKKESPDTSKGEWMRIEECQYAEIMKVKKDARSAFDRTNTNIVIYHWDSLNLSRYSSDEIENIYN